MSDVLYRATKYMIIEDSLLAREENPKKRERGRRKPGKIEAKRWQEREIKEMIDDPNPRQGGSQTSLP